MHFKHLVPALGVPTTAVGEMRQMIEGRLIVEVWKLQVVLGAMPSNTFCLGGSIPHSRGGRGSSSKVNQSRRAWRGSCSPSGRRLEAVKAENSELHQQLDQEWSWLREL